MKTLNIMVKGDFHDEFEDFLSCVKRSIPDVFWEGVGSSAEMKLEFVSSYEGEKRPVRLPKVQIEIFSVGFNGEDLASLTRQLKKAVFHSLNTFALIRTV